MINKRPSDLIIFSTVRIENYMKNGEISYGTGFFYGFKDVGFLVTNKHVLKDAKYIEFKVFTQNEKGDVDYNSMATMRLYEDDLQKKSCGHPSEEVDIQAIALDNVLINYGTGNKVPYTPLISAKLIPDQTALENLFAIEHIVFVGYPNAMWDNVNHLPIVRTGTTASLLTKDFDGKPKFLIDASVFPGSSGSPVFIIDESWYGDRTGTFPGQTRLFFLGVVSGVYSKRNIADIEIIPVPTTNKPVALVKQVLDLGVVEKATTVVETVELCYNKITQN